MNTDGQTNEAKISREQTEKTGIAGMIQFTTEALMEARKVTWPDRQQVIKETLSVIFLVGVITCCVLGFDFSIAKVVFEPLDKVARHLGGGIGVHH
jgi:preprotein translocase SecE subunit